MENKLNNTKVVILGTAHGINVAGKRSPDGKFREYKFSREVIQMIKPKLEAMGYIVYIDIIADVVPLPQSSELKKRVQIVNDICKKHGTANCIYVSIHNDAAGNGREWHNAKGFSVHVSIVGSEKSKKLAKIFTSNAIRDDLCGNRSIPTCKYHSSNFYVLNNTICPAVLTENLFQDSKEDVDFLLSDKGKNAIVNLHVNSINEYFRTL